MLKEATALGGAGFDVTVMTVANHASSEVYDRELMQHAPFKRIVLDHLAGRWMQRKRILASRLGTWLARRLVALGLELPPALGPAHALGRMARAFPADLVIVHTELPFYIGRTLLAQGRRVAADFEDWHSRDLLPTAQTTRPLRLIRSLERELMQKCAYTSTTSHALAAALQSAGGGRLPVVITNSFPLQPDPAEIPHSQSPSFFWFSQTIGAGRGLEIFIAAWRQMQQPSRLCLLGDISPDYRQKLLGRVPPARRHQLEFLPLVSPEALPSVIARHDVGLALERPEPPSRDLTITNKILQYFNAGLAVIASDTSGQREVMTRVPAAGLLVALNETGELARQLDELLSDPARLAAMGAAARRAAREIYCWEQEAPRLVATVDAALARPAKSPGPT